ncbi:hypothetical protein AVEN_198016-1, partial [Araneus ventricosus]
VNYPVCFFYRLRNCLPAHVTDITPQDLEEKAIGWTSHPSQNLEINQVNISEDGDLPPQRADVRIFTDGSKTDDGVGAALCVQEQNTWTHNWSAKLNDNSTVFQAELTALKEAVELATQYPPSTSISIHVDNRASLQATSNPKTTSPTARKIFIALLNNTNITLHWIKAHAGHEGNEKADQLAKEASATGNMYDNQKLPKPYIKSILKNKMMQQWQLEWNKSDTGKKIRDILPKVSTHSANWSREEIIFFSEHGPFPAYRKRFGLHESDICGCGKVGTAIHYATECIFTESWHMTKPSQDNLQAWQKSVAANVHARFRIKHIISFIHSNLDLFKLP